MRHEYDGDLEPPRGAEHLACGNGVRRFLYLDEVWAAVAEQGLERAPAVRCLVELSPFAHPARGQRKHLEPALPLPCDVDRPAEPRLAPALRNGDGDLEAPGRERAQFAAVSRLEIGVGEDEDSSQNGRHRTRTCDLRYVRPAL